MYTSTKKTKATTTTTTTTTKNTKNEHSDKVETIMISHALDDPEDGEPLE